MNIAIIGAGVSGLSCAVRLLEHGHRVSIFAERRSPDTTSDRSAAAFTPFRAPESERLRRWTQRSFGAFVEISADRDSGVRMRPTTEFFFDELVEMPWWTSVIPDVNRLSSVPTRYRTGIRAIMPTMDMTRYMPWLQGRVHVLGGTIEAAFVEDLRAPIVRDFDVLVNASGLGARKIAHDPAMTPMRGQIVHSPNDIGLQECFADQGRGQQATYVFPFEKHIALGGTYERGVESPTTDEASLDHIVDRCRTLLREVGHPRWNDLARKRLRTWAGLRPARVVDGDDEAIRLELELVEGQVPVVHDYGHGRIGVTVSWGCAQDVVEIVEQLR